MILLNEKSVLLRCIQRTQFEFYSVIDEIFVHRAFVIHIKNVRVDSVDIPQCMSIVHFCVSHSCRINIRVVKK
jgi:carbonic anhydrase/acetyltransferase-like protein (isoleucine patch superfamily)